MNTTIGNRLLPMLAALGLCLAFASVPRPGWAGDFGIYGGVALGDFHVGTDSWLRLGYARHSGDSAWAVSLGYNTPYYYHRAPRHTYYSYYPRHYAYPHRSSLSLGYSHGRGDHWGVSYRQTWRSYPYRRGYAYPAYGYRYGYSYGPYPRGYVSGVYRWDDANVAVGVAVPVVVGSEYPPRPSVTERIVRSGPVERNPIMKRVWVAGRYETVADESGKANNQEASSRRVWVPGHWEYVPDTY